jgi:uncharacterized cupin superfamily protein
MPETRIGRIGEPSSRMFSPTHHPEWFTGQHEQRLARVLGVTQFGVNHLTLEPGAYSALRTGMNRRTSSSSCWRASLS